MFISYRCSCPTGYKLDEVDSRSCWSINECEVGSGQECMHVCQDTDDGYSCFCRNGFNLLDDGKACQGKDNNCAELFPRIYL